MRFYKAGEKNLAGWIEDSRLFMDAYHAANRDQGLKNEIKELEARYIRMYLVKLAGEESADRIMAEFQPEKGKL